MELILSCLATIICIYLLITLIETYVGLKLIKNLRYQTIAEENTLPFVSIILSARNEEAEIEKTLNSLLKMNYPRFEIIAINDRSEDNTYQCMLKVQDPRLRIYQINSLPDKWFGKNHALNFAASKAQGDWLLFTDADILMKPDLLAKSMSYVNENKIDHLTMVEYHCNHNFWLNIVLFGLYLTTLMISKPWRYRYSWSKNAGGYGAFNLVRTQAYFNAGTHNAIAMECLDDVQLGVLIKLHGYKQDIVDGRDYLQREWYTSLNDILSGMKKNTAAFRDFKFSAIFLDSIFAIICYILPFFAVVFFSGFVFWINLLNIILLYMICYLVATHYRESLYYIFFFPISILFVIYSAWNSYIGTVINHGVVWRGTLYPLEDILNRRRLAGNTRKSSYSLFNEYIKTELSKIKARF